MKPPRIADLLLAATVRKRDLADNIRGDLYDEYRELPRAWRDTWYLWQAVTIAARFAVSRLRRRRPARRDPQRRAPRAFAVGGDLRQALRMLRRRPAFVLITVATLGLGIGATTTIISVVDRVMIRPLPYPDASELVTVWNTYPRWRGHEVLDPIWDRIQLSYPEYRDWRDGQRAMEDVAIYVTTEATLTGLGDPAIIGFGAASPSLFPLLGAGAHVGRTFAPEETGASAPRVALVSYAFWSTRLGGIRDLAGRSVTVDGQSYQVIGVLPGDFRIRSHTGLATRSPDVWVPAGSFGESNDRGWHLYEGIARLRPGMTTQQAAVDAQPLLGGGADTTARGVRVLPRQAAEVAAARGPLLLLSLAAVLLMSIAGVNVATLFTAEAARRRHEVATRRALGAGRWQITRQLVVESGLIGLLGAVAGIAGAFVGIPVLLGLAPAELGLPAFVPIDARVLGVTTIVGVVVGIAFGVGPGLLALSTATPSVLALRAGATDRTAARAQRVLIAVEAALAIVLLVGAGLLGRSLLNLDAVDPGFSRQNLVAVNVPIAGANADEAFVLRLARDLVEQLGAAPGIEAATVASSLPFSGEGGSSSFDIEGREVPDEEKGPEAHRLTVAPGFHEMLRIPLVAGRTFSSADAEGGHGVVVVSEALARRYWPGTSPVGSFIVRDRRRWEVIGVVRDVRLTDLTETHQSTFYFPFWQQPPDRFWLVLRSPLELDALAPVVRHVVARLAPDVAVGRMDRISSLVDASTVGARYRATLVAAFGGVALLLAAIGLFGLTARMVAGRRRELGIRVALGAHKVQIVRAVMRTEANALGIGIVGGLVLSVFAVRGLDAFLFGVSPWDPLTFIAAAAVLAVAGFLATYLPARRASRMDPMEALRVE